MSLSPHDIQRLATLSRLPFDETQAERIRGELNGFFAIVEQMRSIDTQGIVPMSHPVDAMPTLASTVDDADAHGMNLRLRDDLVSEPNQREANMHNAPAQERGLFLVPKVIE